MDEDDIDLGQAEACWRWGDEFRTQAMRVLGDDPGVKMAVTHVTQTRTSLVIGYNGIPPGRRAAPTGRWTPDRPMLVGLLARAYQHRSLRLDLKTGLVRPQPANWSDIVRPHFPHRFGAVADVGDGWADLILAVCGVLDERGIAAKFVQIKEKFGELRLYNDGPPDAWEVEHCASLLSYLMCETCGAPGRIRTGGWVKTLCELHAEERQ